jgi:HPt (histidine-containing phosphotransfer) domain-containing protein
MSNQADPIHSEFVSDTEMRELIQMFVEEMPARIAELERAWSDANMNDLMRYAHQLKGAAPGYGFTQMGQAAAEVESAVRASEELSRIRAELDALVSLCGRAAA